ncbi:MAG: 4Fe-4S ferredoxin [Deltaproteobacteria bacterium]|nr:4Fe-4S ferredoxin [Deltaproteobacteria bacterium]
MCEFCVKHGEGKKWYLQAKNYSDDLLSDLSRRRFIQEFLSNPQALAQDVRRLERLDKAPLFLRGLIGRSITRKMKRVHFGQIVPLEDVEKIFEFVTSIVRVACICRQASLGQEKRYCYGISLAPQGGRFAEIVRGLDGSYLTGPDNQGLEVLNKEEALSAFRAHEREGLCHSVWTFHTPFIGGICNCDRSDCMALRCTVSHAVPVMFRGEYVARVDPDRCRGCRECLRLCQFGGLSYSAATQKAVIDQRWCYGCGVCRTACKQEAISLTERSSVPAVAHLW